MRRIRFSKKELQVLDRICAIAEANPDEGDYEDFDDKSLQSAWNKISTLLVRKENNNVRPARKLLTEYEATK